MSNRPAFLPRSANPFRGRLSGSLLLRRAQPLAASLAAACWPGSVVCGNGLHGRGAVAALGSRPTRQDSYRSPACRTARHYRRMGVGKYCPAVRRASPSRRASEAHRKPKADECVIESKERPQPHAVERRRFTMDSCRGDLSRLRKERAKAGTQRPYSITHCSAAGVYGRQAQRLNGCSAAKRVIAHSAKLRSMNRTNSQADQFERFSGGLGGRTFIGRCEHV
jgi:hypothetical protein